MRGARQTRNRRVPGAASTRNAACSSGAHAWASRWWCCARRGSTLPTGYRSSACARALPALRDEDDVYTNHVHADDLAAAALRAMAEDAPSGIYNASDDTHMKMGQWLDLVADRAGLPRPARIARRGAESRIPAALLSFMCESRRLDNRKLKETLGVRLRHPTVYDGLSGAMVAA